MAAAQRPAQSNFRPQGHPRGEIRLDHLCPAYLRVVLRGVCDLRPSRGRRRRPRALPPRDRAWRCATYLSVADAPDAMSQRRWPHRDRGTHGTYPLPCMVGDRRQWLVILGTAPAPRAQPTPMSTSPQNPFNSKLIIIVEEEIPYKQ